MQENYTQQVLDFYLDMFDSEMAAIRVDIASTPEDTSAEQWKQKLNRVADEFCLSGRYGLIRILNERAKKTKEKKEVGVFDADFDYEKELEFISDRKNIDDINYVKNLTPEENLQFINLLMKIASIWSDADDEVNKAAISRVWHDVESANSVSEILLDDELFLHIRDLKKARKLYESENKAKYKTRITREEVLLLGHILDFSLEEIQWFLLRTLDTEEELRFNKANDVIEAYGFLTHSSWQHVETLKKEYEKIAINIEKNNDDSRNEQWTLQLSCTLGMLVKTWNQFPESRDEQFLKWMESKASGLDINSRTALKVYRNLAAIAYGMLIREKEVPFEEEFLDLIQNLCSEANETYAVRKYLYQNNTISAARCKIIADALITENKEMSLSRQSDKTKAWHILTTNTDKSLSSTSGVFNATRTRLLDTLTGDVQIEKADMLYLLWFTANLIWTTPDFVTDNNTLYCRVIDFMEAAELILKSALLAGFYPPHLIEQSMLLSIVSNTETESSAAVYEYMLYSFIEHRKRMKKTTESEKNFFNSRG